jgi:Ca-activated chloride channel family protein
MQFLNGSFLLLALLVALLIPFVKKRSLLFATLFLSLALARPVIFDGYKTIKDSNIEVVLALDLSRSMQLDDIEPSRRDVAIEKLKKFVLLSDDFPMALIIFGRKSEIVVPMTTDKTLILERLSAIKEFDYAKGDLFRFYSSFVVIR